MANAFKRTNVDPVAAGFLDKPVIFSSGASIIVVQEDKVEAFKDVIKTAELTEKKETPRACEFRVHVSNS